MWLLAVEPFSFTVNYIKGEENVAADKLSRNPWPEAIPQAVEIIQLVGEIELDTDEQVSDSDCDEEREAIFQ